MRLYQAMLEGSKRTYQAFGTWHDGDGGTCAMGAVMTGLGYVINAHDWYEAFKRMQSEFPELMNDASCPECGPIASMWGKVPTLMDVIMHLNDRHKWSRQRIAEWLSGSRISEPKKEEVAL